MLKVLKEVDSVAKAGRSLHVLLVEDSPINQMLAARFLEKRGHRVLVAGDGKRALELMSSRRFDLVLMDVQVPGMDGLEVAARIRRLEGESAHTPIIAMTACALEEDRRACLAAGMDAYISKPINWGELFELMDRVVRQSEAEALDWDEALSLVGGDRELLKEAARIFLEDAPGLLSKIKEAIGRRDAEALERAAHTLKGQASSFIAKRACEAALKLEMMGRRGDISQAEEAFAELEEAVSGLSQALARRIES
jgi:CheY-like chemotaxis protein